MRRASKPRVVNGFQNGDVGYTTSDKYPGKQVQVRISALLSSGACLAHVIMMRHRETIDGRETGVWNRWTPENVPGFISHTRDIKRSPEEL